MATAPDHNEQLLQRYLDGHCTAEEVAALYAWLQTSGAHKSLLARMQQEFEEAMHTPASIPASISDRMETRLLQEIGQQEIARQEITAQEITAQEITGQETTPPERTQQEDPKETGKLIRMQLIRRIAVAVIIGIALGASWAIYTRHASKPAIVADASLNAHKDIAPGTNKAMLTLANGKTITLDSAGNKVIEEGSTSARQHNGLLQYGRGSEDNIVEYNVLTVPRGGQFNVVLPDGSKVWLNAASSLRYPTAFTGAKREVELQGQGYFEIAKNASQPFIVRVNDAMDVQVLGTHFDIMAYADEKNISTTLLEGAVKVVTGNVAKSLKPGQQAFLDPSTGAITVQSGADVEQAIAWKTGFFEFDNANLSLITRQLSRWYDVDVVNKAPQSKRLFGGRISRNLPLSDILHMLEANGAAFTLEGRQLIVNEK